ncbi:succinate dehydrogenase [ubiquinone] cytochrome b small subunit, mitochondrial [Drosophila busckii]|uniref:succinate dehydrogenase [ubiquinone] cytochrome b small subunit, mitochondrial n=1 Tax=Drosophila busckii TaxID=30019 RepID=UPI00083EB271|nr:succinate dehydrogenase [ubiquinone] cytochrome b small subunit, mitochondrial [Drosophila busckii]XP_017845278.1 succinate dehydrogenase [ubiquinone] cytochrome b small subunit, mitochondrial [Drosophila busckii]
MFSLVLRDAARRNAANLVKSSRLTPLKAYSTIVANTERQVLAKPLALVKNVAPVVVRNISASAPKMAAAGGNHTTLWTVERVVSAALLGVIPGAFIFPSQVMDALLAISVVIHNYWGIEALVVDYMRPSVVGNVLPKLAHGALILISMAALGGLFYYIKNDVGLVNGIKRFWAIKGSEA